MKGTMKRIFALLLACLMVCGDVFAALADGTDTITEYSESTSILEIITRASNKVPLYVCINGTWTNIGELDRSTNRLNNRHYVTNSDVRALLAAHGIPFIAGGYHFGYVTENDYDDGDGNGEINHSTAAANNGNGNIYVGNSGYTSYLLFYLPQQNGRGETDWTDNTLIQNSTFYTVTLQDENGESQGVLTHVLRNAAGTFSVPSDADEYVVISQSGQTIMTVAAGSTVTLTADQTNQPYIVKARPGFKLTLEANGGSRTVSVNRNVNLQSWLDDNASTSYTLNGVTAPLSAYEWTMADGSAITADVTVSQDMSIKGTLKTFTITMTTDDGQVISEEVPYGTKVKAWLEAQMNTVLPNGRTPAAYAWTYADGTAVGDNDIVKADVDLSGKLITYTLGLTAYDGTRTEFTLPANTNISQWIEENKNTLLSNGERLRTHLWSYADGKVIGTEDVLTGDTELQGEETTCTVTLITEDGEELSYEVDKGRNLRSWVSSLSSLPLDNGNTIGAYDWKIRALDTDLAIGSDITITESMTLYGTKKAVFTVTFDPGRGSFSGGTHEYSVYRGSKLSYGVISMQEMQLVPPENLSFVGWYFYTGDYDQPPYAYVPEDKKDYMLFTSSTQVTEDMVVMAAYDESCTVTYYTDSSLTEVLYEVTIPYGSSLAEVADSLPSDEVMADFDLPPENLVLNYWVDSTDSMATAFSMNQAIKSDLQLYPVFRRHQYVFKQEDGTVVLSVPAGATLQSGIRVEENQYFDSITVKNPDGTEVELSYDLVADPQALEALGVEMPEPVDGNYEFTVTDVDVKEKHTIVYHPGENASITGAGLDGNRRVVVERETSILSSMHIFLDKTDSSGRVLNGWLTPEGESISAGAVMTDDDLEEYWDENGELHLTPEWTYDENAWKVIFHYQYPSAAQFDGGTPSETEYIVYIPREDGESVYPVMPTQQESKYLIPSDKVTLSTGEVVDRFVPVGWSLALQGSTDSDTRDGVYQEGMQHAHALTADETHFYLRWVDRANDLSTNRNVMFFFRDDGSVPQEPKLGQDSSAYFDFGETLKASDVLHEETNIVNDPARVMANIKEGQGPDKETIWDRIVENRNGEGSNSWERIKKSAIAEGLDPINDNLSTSQLKALFSVYEDIWYAEWYVLKLESDGWHVDGRIMTYATRKLVYNANGGLYPPPSQSVVGEDDDTPPSLEVVFSSGGVYPRRDNYEFVGWSENQFASPFEDDGSKIYKEENAPESIILTQSTHTLYAVWKPNYTTIPATGPFQGLKMESHNGGAETTPQKDNLPYYTFNMKLEEYIGKHPTVVQEWEKTVTLTKSDTDGMFDFGTYNVHAPGVYRFVVWESSNMNKPEIQYDASEYELTLLIEETKYGLEVKSYTFSKDGETMSMEAGNTSFENFEPVFKFVNRTGTRSVEVTKVWDDDNNRDGLRPNNISVRLLSNGTPVGQNVVLNASNGWTYTWDGLPSLTGTKANIYTVEEILADSNVYTSSGPEGDMNSGFVITNTYTPKNVSVAIYKYWNDEGYADRRPESISFKIYGTDRLGQLRVSQSVTMDGSDAVSRENMWYWLVEDLPMYVDASLLNYTISEVAVDGYASTMEMLPDVEDGTLKAFKVTNTFGKASVTIQKVVEGNMGWYDSAFDFTALLTQSDGSIVMGMAQPADGSYTVDANGQITFQLKHGESITLEDLPRDCTLTLTEASNGHTVSYAVEGAETQRGATATFSLEDGMTITVTNHKQAEIATSVRMDAAPYWLLLGLSLAGWLMMKQKRRTE